MMVEDWRGILVGANFTRRQWRPTWTRTTSAVMIPKWYRTMKERRSRSPSVCHVRRHLPVRWCDATTPLIGHMLHGASGASAHAGIATPIYGVRRAAIGRYHCLSWTTVFLRQLMRKRLRRHWSESSTLSESPSPLWLIIKAPTPTPFLD